MVRQNPDQTPRLAGPSERIQRLARPYGLLANAARHLSGNTGKTLMMSLLIELDETILPRHFTLETDTGHSVGLRVAGRRLLRIDQAVGDTQPGSAGEILAQLQQVFDGATKAWLCCRRAVRADPGANPGIAISALVAAGGLIQSAPAAHDPVPDLFNALSGRLTAWLMLNSPGNKVEQGGDSTQLHRLDTLAREGLEDIEIQMTHSLADPKGPGCVMLPWGGTNGLTLLYARSGHARLLALLASREISCVLPAWRAFYHGR
ncbi:MAG: hypothetical protein L3J36_11540 [Rhodobacteraceae bacterium]|nr:hypothetical protein [Paracoccaceae bacterium]